jgi:hypothetical protein
MTGTPKETVSGQAGKSLPEQATAALRFTLKLPFKVAARLIQHAVQILFALFVLFLHPQLKWLFRLIADSAVVRHYIRPGMRRVGAYVYDPYFDFLGDLPPYWATFSVALPLAILEPAKLGATVLIAEKPKAGIVIWLALQAVSLLLIDQTWTAVRPQARKIRLVACAHAWLWLNAEHGKYWIRNSQFYRTVALWVINTRRFFRRLRLRLLRKKAGIQE